MNIKGSLPLLLLHLLSYRARHGYDIAKYIKRVSANKLEFKEGALYPTLHRMEEEGYVTTYTQEESGRLRRYYQITDKGRAELVKQRAEWNQYYTGVNLILEAGDLG